MKIFRSERAQPSRLSLIAAILVSFPLFSCATTKPAPAPTFEPTGRVEYDALLLLFKQQSTTPEVTAYTSRGTKQTSSSLMRVMASCTRVGPDAVWPQMLMILKINEHGVVEEARIDMSSTLASCVEQAWVGKQYDSPPFAPFYRLVSLDAHSRGGV
jgi:hypothetical protein